MIPVGTDVKERRLNEVCVEKGEESLDQFLRPTVRLRGSQSGKLDTQITVQNLILNTPPQYKCADGLTIAYSYLHGFVAITTIFFP